MSGTFHLISDKLIADLHLTAAEKYDGYLRQLATSPYNSQARLGTVYKPVDLRASPAGLQTALRAMESTFGWWDELQDVCPRDVSLVLLDPTAEHGRPHTRGLHTICVPATRHWTETSLRTVLSHEAVHLSQKQFPLDWQRALLAWEFTHIPVSVTQPSALFERERLNPDTLVNLGGRFAWRERFIALPLFHSRTAAQATDNGVGQGVGIYWTQLCHEDCRAECYKQWCPRTARQWNEHPFESSAYLLPASPGVRRTQLLDAFSKRKIIIPPYP